MRQEYEKINYDELKKIVQSSDSLVEVTQKLGFDPYYGNTKKNVERLIKRNNISIEHFSTVRRVRDYTTRYEKEKLIIITKNSKTLKEILTELDILPLESNYKTLKKYLQKYEIDYSHIKRYQRKNRIINEKYEESNFKNIIFESSTFREVFKKLGLEEYGNNYGIVHKYIKKYNIDISHFNNKKSIDRLSQINRIPLSEILVENSTYNNGTTIKKRLYEGGLKTPVCEKCGQDEWWHGEKISLILDHINGRHNDNRIENLRIVCPNCEGTLPTHCGKNNKKRRSGGIG